MAIVFDSNQAGLFCNKAQKNPRLLSFDIALPPNVLAELILWGKEPQLSQIYDLKPKIGLHLGDVATTLAKSNEDEIKAFRPFPSSATFSSELYGELMNALRAPSPQQRQWAIDFKKKNKSFCDKMKKKALVFRQILNDKKSKGIIRGNFKVESITAAFDAFGKGAQSFIGSIVASFIGGGGGTYQSAIKDPEKLYGAVMANPFVCGFFKTVLFYILSYSRLWDHAHQYLNFDPSSDRDDWVDMTVPLYASTGDIILTDDKKLKNAISTVYVNSNVIAKKVADL